jgi:hypothetical protein
MNRRRTMTLTTLGLSLRDETLVKSLLNLVEANTRADWKFVDEIEADLALCDPQSPLARMAMQRAQQVGRPHCVALLHDQNAQSPIPHSIRAPLRVREFIDMLDALCDAGGEAVTPAGPGATSHSHSHATEPAPAPGEPLQGLTLADALSKLIATEEENKRSQVWRIALGDSVLDVILPECRYALSGAEVSLQALVDLALSRPIQSIVRLAPEDRAPSSARSVARPLQPLLWRIGLVLPVDPGTPWLKEHVALRLKRWPDFGSLGSHKSHLALSALLTKRSWRIDDLVQASGESRAMVLSFLNTCGLCGLLVLNDVAPKQIEAPSKRRRFGVSGLFQAFRSALRIGD